MSEIPPTGCPISRLFERYVKPFLTPYYFVVAAVLGAITAVFAIVTVLLIMVVANFNLLTWIE